MVAHDKAHVSERDIIKNITAGAAPLFGGKIAESYPVNSSPYVIAVDDFYMQFSGTPKRDLLLKNLTNFDKYLGECGARAVCLLVGGSFCNSGNTEPRDMDGLLMFEFANCRSSLESLIVDWRRLSAGHDLDFRFVPVDLDPIYLVKVACFMSALFARTRDSDASAHGCWLVDFRYRRPDTHMTHP